MRAGRAVTARIARAKTPALDRPPPLVPRADWDPWFDRGREAFRPLREAAGRFRAFATWPPPEAWNDALGELFRAHSAGGAPLRFVRQTPRKRARRGRRGAPAVDLAGVYDERIYAAGEVPSRAENWHDFFNMLVWATFPDAKRALNARQRAALRAHVPEGAARIPGARTREQDALSMLDEGGLILLCAPAAFAAARAAVAAGDAPALAELARRGRPGVVGDTDPPGYALRALVLGHALYEHLVSSDAPVRAAAVALAAPGPLPAGDRETVALADALLAAELARPGSFLSPAAEPAVPLAPALFPPPG